MSAEQKMNVSPVINAAGNGGAGKSPAILQHVNMKHTMKKKHVDPFKDLMKKKAGNDATRKKIRELKNGRYDFFDDQEDDDDDNDLSSEEEGKEMNLDTSGENDEEEDDDSYDEDVSKSLSSGDECSEDSYEKKKEKPIFTQRPPPPKRTHEETTVLPNKKPRNLSVPEHKFTVKDEERLNQVVKIVRMNLEELTIADENFTRTTEKIRREVQALEAKEKSCLEAIAALERTRATATASPLVVPSDENAQQQVSGLIKERFAALEVREAEIVEKENALALKTAEQEKASSLIAQQEAEQNNLSRRLVDQEKALALKIAEQEKASKLITQQGAEQNSLARRLADQEHALSLKTTEQEKSIAAKRAEQNKYFADKEQEVALLLKRVADEERVVAFKTSEYNTLATKVAEEQTKLKKELATLDINLAQFVKQQEALTTQKIELEKKEKALGALATVNNNNNKRPLANVCHEMMMSKNTNTLSYEDMSSIVPEHLMRKLGYLAGQMPLKYNSFSNDEYIMVEVTSPNQANANEPPLIVMRHVVYKQLLGVVNNQ